MHLGIEVLHHISDGNIRLFTLHSQNALLKIKPVFWLVTPYIKAICHVSDVCELLAVSLKSFTIFYFYFSCTFTYNSDFRTFTFNGLYMHIYFYIVVLVLNIL